MEENKNYDITVVGGGAVDVERFELVDGSYVQGEKHAGGKGFNQAIAASRAGANTAIVGVVGNDINGKFLVDSANKSGVDISHVEVLEGINTDWAKIEIKYEDKDNNIQRMSGEAIDRLTPELVDKNEELLLNSKTIVAQLKCPKETTEALIDFCHKNNKTLVLTPCRPERLSINDEKNLENIEKITYITCNEKECQTIFNTDDIESCVEKYPNKLIVTLGAKGVMYHNGESVVHIPAKKIDGKIVDSVGAGDTFAGNFATAITKGLTIEEAIERGQYASSMSIMKEGATEGMPTEEELDEYIDSFKDVNLESNKSVSMQSIVSNAINQGITTEDVEKSDNIEEHEEKNIEGVSKDD